MIGRLAKTDDAHNLPRMMTIREIAKTGLLPEHALRIMWKQGKLPGITVGNKVLINFDALLDQLHSLSAVR